MNILRKFIWVLGLPVAMCGLATPQVYAQTTESVQEETSPAPEEKKEEKEEEKEAASNYKIKASVGVSGAYDVSNFYEEKDKKFGPASVPMTSGGDNGDNGKKSVFEHSVKLTIEKELVGKILKLVITSDLKEGYGEYGGLRIGKAASSFSSGTCGLAGRKAVQVRWLYKVDNLSYTLGIEAAPDFEIYPKEKKEEDKKKKPLAPLNNLPAAAANVKYEIKKTFHACIGGVLRALEHRTNKDETCKILPAFGATLGLKYHAIPDVLTVKGEGVYGHGIGGYMADLKDLKKEYNTVYHAKGDDDATTPKMIDAWGAGAGAEWKFMPQWSLEGAYRLMSTMEDKRDKDAFQLGHLTSGNVCYEVTKQFKVGVGYLFAARKNIGTKKMVDSQRATAMIKFEL